MLCASAFVALAGIPAHSVDANSDVSRRNTLPESFGWVASLMNSLLKRRRSLTRHAWRADVLWPGRNVRPQRRHDASCLNRHRPAENESMR